MIRTKNNFKSFLRKKYPNITAQAVYNMNAYILDKSLNPLDAYTYMQQQLANGHYIVFFGYTVMEVKDLMTGIKNNGVPVRTNRRDANGIPTTFASFEQYLLRHNINYSNRTFMPRKTPYDCLTPTGEGTIMNCANIREPRTWYMYSFPRQAIDVKFLSNQPYIITVDSDGTEEIVMLIKASSSRYKSKRQRLTERFSLMQPIYEQLIAAMAQGMEDEATGLANAYLSTQFEKPVKVKSYQEMKEAYDNGILQLFLRDPENVHIESDDEL